MREIRRSEFVVIFFMQRGHVEVSCKKSPGPPERALTNYGFLKFDVFCHRAPIGNNTKMAAIFFEYLEKLQSDFDENSATEIDIWVNAYVKFQIFSAIRAETVDISK